MHDKHGNEVKVGDVVSIPWTNPDGTQGSRVGVVQATQPGSTSCNMTVAFHEVLDGVEQIPYDGLGLASIWVDGKRKLLATGWTTSTAGDSAVLVRADGSRPELPKAPGPSVRAKFRCSSAEKSGEGDNASIGVAFDAVYGADGTPNAQWSRWTPSGRLTMGITNPGCFDRFVQGKEYYLDFTPAED